MSADADNLTQMFFVVGVYDDRKVKTLPRSASNEMVIVRYVKTGNGWKQRCIVGNEPALNNDYVSQENREDLNQWLVVDFTTRYRVVSTQEESMAYRDQHVLHI